MATYEDDELTSDQRRRLDQLLQGGKMKPRFSIGDAIFLAVLLVSGIPLTLLVYNLMNLFIGVLLFCLVMLFFLGAIVKRV